MSRQLLDSPFLSDHTHSRVRRDRPETLHQYLIWLRRAVFLEYPDHLNDSDLGEGGTPNLNREFIAYVEGSPYARDEDGSYRFPLRAALAFVARGPRNGSGNPFMARFVYAISRGLPWSDVSGAFGIPPDVSPVYAKEALARVFDAYQDFS